MAWFVSNSNCSSNRVSQFFIFWCNSIVEMLSFFSFYEPKVVILQYFFCLRSYMWSLLLFHFFARRSCWNPPPYLLSFFPFMICILIKLRAWSVIAQSCMLGKYLLGRQVSWLLSLVHIAEVQWRPWSIVLIPSSALFQFGKKYESKVSASNHALKYL